MTGKPRHSQLSVLLGVSADNSDGHAVCGCNEKHIATMTHMNRGCIDKKISGLKKKAKKVPRVFFQNKCSGTKTKVRSGCRRSPLSPLLADFVNSLLIGNRPPWHLSLDILTSRTQFWLHSGTGATLARATVKPESRVWQSLW